MKFILFIVSILMLVSCSLMQENVDFENITFKSSTGVITFNSKNELFFNNHKYLVSNCSSSITHCLSYEEIGLILEVPKRCHSFNRDWFPDKRSAWKVIGGAGHERLYYSMKNNDMFNFVYSSRYGIQVIEWVIDDIRHEFYLQGSSYFLPCEFNN